MVSSWSLLVGGVTIGEGNFSLTSTKPEPAASHLNKGLNGIIILKTSFSCLSYHITNTLEAYEALFSPRIDPLSLLCDLFHFSTLLNSSLHREP